MKTSFKLILISCALISLVYSCKKDSELTIDETPSGNPTIVAAAPDSIYHKILSPYIILNPITNLVLHVTGCGYVYNPFDTITTYDLDLDSNGVNDLHFISKSYYEIHSASYPCVNFLRATTISPLNSNYSLGIIPPTSPTQYQTYYYSLGDTIGASCIFDNLSNFSAIYYNYGFYPVSVHGGDFYLPIKKILNNKTQYGWMKIDTIGYGGIIIKEYAINSTNNNQIICGQIH